MTAYLSCAETAKLVRKALKEAFPGIKFSVRSKTYSGGASIDVHWTDGPADCQVKPLVCAFQGGSFDAMTDYKGGVVHTMNGQSVHFGADFIFTHREYTLAMLKRGLAQVAKETNNEFDPDTIEIGQSEFSSAYINENRMLTQGWHQNEPLDRAVHCVLAKRSQIATHTSPTAHSTVVERTY